MQTAKEIGRLDGHTGRVSSLAFSPDGKLLASASYDKSIRVWDVAGRKELCQCRGHQGRATSVAFSQDGKQLVSGGVIEETIKTPKGSVIGSGWADHLRVWDAASGKQLRKLAARGFDVSFSPDGGTLVVGGLLLDIQMEGDRERWNGKDYVSLLAHISHGRRKQGCSPAGK